MWSDINIFLEYQTKNIAGTSFEEIIVHKFDAELRELFFKYLLQIERQMRFLRHTILLKCAGAEQKQY